MRNPQRKTVIPWAGRAVKALSSCLAVLLLSSSCARMGNPDGGWYDETPPRVVGASPADGAVNVSQRKIVINFDEFVKIDNPTENVIVSPPQLEQPEIKGAGKRIIVELKDSLRPNTTYTVDFSDAISDNNEGNPLGNYTYSFSTGAAIDTMEVSGYVLNAENLEPVKGILVGLYADSSQVFSPAQSAFTKSPLLRVAKTNGSGRFVIKGVANGHYRAYALQDMDNDFKYSQKSETVAFSHDIITPTSRPDFRQDTIWRDSLHIESIKRTGYTHFLPDNIVLKAFSQPLTDRYLLKSERLQANRFTLFFSYGSKQLPVIKGLNFNERDAFVTEFTPRKDTITYWLRDTALVNQDTLRMQVAYEMTDSASLLVSQTDTLEILSKLPYARRMKQLQNQRDEWQKQQDKLKRRGLPYDSVMPAEALRPEYRIRSYMSPDQNIDFMFPAPMQVIDTTKIHLYAKHDSLWYIAKFRFLPMPEQARRYQLRGEWRPGIEYSLETDSAAFIDIYDNASARSKEGFKIKTLDEFSSLLFSLQGMDGKTAVVQLLNGSDVPVKEVTTTSGQAEFYYVAPGKYYLRLYIDENSNGQWDTGDFEKDLQAEPVYYYPDAIECKAKWDVNLPWNPTARPINLQKPEPITKQKPDKAKTIKRKNAQRAKQLGIKNVPKM